MTFTTDIDDLIRLDRGDTKRLRNIRDVVKHDNFITSVDKKYVESLISTYLRNQSLDGSEVNIKSRTVVELKDNVKPTGRETTSSSSLFSGSNNKKLGILAGVAAAIALVVVVGFSASTDQIDITTVSDIIPSSTPQIIINVDGSSYKTADIISVSGSIKSAVGESVELSINVTTIFGFIISNCGKVGPLSLPEDKLDKSVITYPCDESCQKKFEEENNAVCILMSDGELNEGSVWEAFQFISKHRLNVSILIDNNNQICEDYLDAVSPEMDFASIFGRFNVRPMINRTSRATLNKLTHHSPLFAVGAERTIILFMGILLTLT